MTGTRDNYVHFVQEPFDQAALVRFTKWEWTLPSGVVAKETLQCPTIMHTEPKGPVYLMLPREIHRSLERLPGRKFRPAGTSGADPQLVERLAMHTRIHKPDTAHLYAGARR